MELKMFSFNFLLQIIDKKHKEVDEKLNKSKKDLKEFVDKKLYNLNTKAINSKNDIHEKIDKQKKINRRLDEEINKLKNEEEKLIQKIRSEKVNFMKEMDKLPKITILIELKNSFSDSKIFTIALIILILIGTFFSIN